MVTITPSDLTQIAGESFSLECSAFIEVPSKSFNPIFEWFFGPFNSSLPFGVTTSAVSRRNSSYISTLQFSPLQEYHSGVYTCRIEGDHNLSASTVIRVDSGKHDIHSLTSTNHSVF